MVMGPACQTVRETCGSVICDNYLESISHIKTQIIDVENKINMVFGPCPELKGECLKNPENPSPVREVENGLANILDRIGTISDRLKNEL